MTDALDRFAAKVDFAGDCWNWTAYLDPKGYGRFQDGTSRGAHRWIWETVVGPVEDGLELDHLCKNRSCVNPDHLEPVTHAENVARAKSASDALRAHWARWRDQNPRCKNGHEFTEENTMSYPHLNKPRQCRTCNRERSAAHHAANRPSRRSRAEFQN